MTIPNRKYPARGVKIPPDAPTIVFLTVCTKDRKPWLNYDEIHEAIRDAWITSDAWLVGRYVIMPDHIHLFASPDRDTDIDLERWTRLWKTKVSRVLRDPSRRWQKSHWDRRLRSNESYAQKWDYVVNNPVRHGLVERAVDWPYQGDLNPLDW